MVRLGTFELVHKDAYVAVVTAGEVIGHPTLLTGLAPEFTVRAREDSLLYCIPRDEAVGLLGRPVGPAVDGREPARAPAAGGRHHARAARRAHPAGHVGHAQQAAVLRPGDDRPARPRRS